MHPILKTDHYKLTMAEAGWPLRHETFYYSHRKGGPHLLPFDVEKELHKLNPFANFSGTYEERHWLETQNRTPLGAWFHGLKREDFQFQVKAPARGSWLSDRDPMFTVSGSSFAVSWLEPLVLQWNYIIQVATLAVTNPKALQKEVKTVTCNEQKLLILNTLDRVTELGYKVPHMIIEVDRNKYSDYVFNKIKALIAVVKNPNRIFEVGMRGVSCMEQHMAALEAAADAGLKATSNVSGATAFGLKSVGTMGHEHVQRYGSDETAYRAMVERMPGSIFFLLDTFDTYKSGIPSAFKIIAEQPDRNHAVRFDSGDIEKQFLFAVKKAEEMGIKPIFCLEDGWNLEKTIKFEQLRKKLGLPPEQVLYGYGGHIVNSPFTTLTRDRVSAVWKLTQSGGTPTMKFKDTGSRSKGKESIPGQPALYWSESCIFIGQQEEIPSSVECAFSDGAKPIPMRKKTSLYSPGTIALVKQLTKKRNKIIKEIENVN